MGDVQVLQLSIYN